MHCLPKLGSALPLGEQPPPLNTCRLHLTHIPSGTTSSRPAHRPPHQQNPRLRGQGLWAYVHDVDVLIMWLLSRPLGAVRIRCGICRQDWHGCGDLSFLARYRRDLQPMTPLLVGCVRSLKPVAPLLSEISLRWGVVGRPRCRWTVTAHGRASRRRAEPHISDLAPLVWRAPEGPEGTGGLRGAAPNDVRSPSLAGGRGLRRPEHPWGNKQHRNTSGATSTAERRSLRTPRSKRDPGRPGDRRGGQVR